jgi:hypothetical protein
MAERLLIRADGMASLVIGRALQVFSGIQFSVPAFMMSPEWSANKAGALDWRRHMRNIVDEAGEIIARATDDHTLIGGHHRLALAASLGQKLFWKHTGEPVKLDPFFKGSSHHKQPDAQAT